MARYPASINSSQANAWPTARFNSEIRLGASRPTRFTKAVRDMVRMFSQLATQRRGNPSERPNGTSTAICRVVDVISIATNLFRYW
jgi:hypothetical protein